MQFTLRGVLSPQKKAQKVNAAASRLVNGPYDEEAVMEAAHSAMQEMGGQASLGFLFASSHYKRMLPDFLELIQLHGHIPTLIGCSGSGLIGTDRETEHATGFSLLLLHLPETTIRVCELKTSDVENAQHAKDWHRITGIHPGEVETWLGLFDPFGFPVEPWLSGWNEAYPGIPTIGGLCSTSGTHQNEEVFVFHDRTMLPPGSGLAVALQGGVKVRPLLSQGCRPIGEPLTVTGVDGNLVVGLGGKPAYTALAEAFEGLDTAEKMRAQGNLFAGLASSEYVEDFKRGDFLIRAILGADVASGVVALGAYPRVGQTLQWQLRDSLTADIDLRERLSQEHTAQPKPFASLVFACNGRGKDLFGTANHDAHALAQAIGKLPSSGFFCNGEVGPVGKTSFVHGYTAAMALFV